MNIDQYQCDDRAGYLYDECHYDTAEDLFTIGFLGFCGCGLPEDALEYVYESLLLLERKERVPDEMPWEEWDKETNIFFKSDGAKYFMWYFLDNKNLTEHGGSVPGWLSRKGRDLLSDLKEYYGEDE